MLQKRSAQSLDSPGVSVIGSPFSVFGLKFAGYRFTRSGKLKTDKLTADNRQLRTDNRFFDFSRKKSPAQ